MWLILLLEKLIKFEKETGTEVRDIRLTLQAGSKERKVRIDIGVYI